MMQTTYRFAFERVLAMCLIILIGLTNRNIGAELFQNLAGHIGGVVQISFSPDSSRLLTVGLDGKAQLWDIGSRSIIMTLRTPEPDVVCAKFSPDGRSLATGHRNGTVTLWNPDSGAMQGTLPKSGPRDFSENGDGHIASVTALDFSSDGKQLVTGSEDTTVRIWDLDKQKELKTLEEHTSNVCAIRFDWTTQTMASASLDGMLVIWNKDGTPRHKIRVGRTKVPVELAQLDFDRNGESLAVSLNNQVKLYDTATGKSLRSLGTGPSVAFSPISVQIAYPIDKVDVALADRSSAEVQRTLPDHGGEIACLAFSPNGKLLAVSNTRTGVVRLWDLSSVDAGALQLDAMLTRNKWFAKKVLPKVDAPFPDLKKTNWPMTVESIREDCLVMGKQEIRTSDAVLLQDAQSYYTRTLREVPASHVALAYRSLILHYEGQFAKATLDQTKAIELDPDNAAYFRMRGDSYSEQGKFLEAVADYSQAIELDRDYSEAYLRRGVAKLSLDQNGDALIDISKAVDLDPDNGIAYMNLATARIRLGQHDDALRDLDRAIEKKANHPEVFVARAEIFFSRNDFKQAIVECDQAILIDPDLGKAFKLRADANVGIGNQVAADADRLEFQRLDPGSPSHFLNRPILHFDLTQPLMLGSQVVTIARKANGEKLKSINDLYSPVWRPNHQQFAYFSREKESDQYSLWSGDLSGEKVKLLSPEKNQFLQWYPAWSPDGTRIAVISIQVSEDATGQVVEFELLVIDPDTGKIMQRVRFPKGVIAAEALNPPNLFKWSPDGKHVLISWESTVVIDLQNNRSLRVTDGYSVAEWCPDSRSVIYFNFGRNELNPGREQLTGLYRWSLSDESTQLIADKQALSQAGIDEVPGMFRVKLIMSSRNRYFALVVGSIRDFAKVTDIRLYRSEDLGQLDLASPIRTWSLESELPVHLQWSPDETHLSAILLNNWSTLTLEIFRLSTGQRRKLADLNSSMLTPGVSGLDFLGGGKFLSWTD